LLPRVAIIEHPYSLWHWSVHLMSGTWQMQALLFIIAVICAVFLLVGYHTKLATIASWALMVSLNSRNPIIVVGDTLFRALLFWAIFLPWGRRFSIDALRLSPDSKQASQTCFSPATIAYIMQLIFVFWFGVIQKSGAEWRSDGTALYYALSSNSLRMVLDCSFFSSLGCLGRNVHCFLIGSDRAFAVNLSAMEWTASYRRCSGITRALGLYSTRSKYWFVHLGDGSGPVGASSGLVLGQDRKLGQVQRMAQRHGILRQRMWLLSNIRADRGRLFPMTS
jgi:hypothetical protein